MTSPGTEDAIRAAAIEWIGNLTHDGMLQVSREQLASDFIASGERFPLVDRGRGIRRPARWRAALSIMTAFPKPGRGRPYADGEGLDGLHRYKLRGDEGGAAENAGLRTAMEERLPLIWFYGVQPGWFNAISPVWLIAEESTEDQFVMALTSDQLDASPTAPVDLAMRRYSLQQAKQRLHQPLFASQVMMAYETHCAVCALHHRDLLDAAHILPDSHERGEPVVPNGLALCKIHHAAYDRNILGIRPDYVVEIHGRLLEELDGPMLTYGLQGHHGKELMRLPIRRKDKPDPDRLMERYAEFRAA
jgi:putative restriction endonuclease